MFFLRRAAIVHIDEEDEPRLTLKESIDKFTKESVRKQKKIKVSLKYI